MARFGTPLRQLADELGVAVAAVLGPVPVEITFTDIVAADAVLAPTPTGQDAR